MSLKPAAHLIRAFLSSGVLTLSSLCQTFWQKFKIHMIHNKIHNDLVDQALWFDSLHYILAG